VTNARKATFTTVGVIVVSLHPAVRARSIGSVEDLPLSDSSVEVVERSRERSPDPQW
jgi:hypothetical protein